MSPETRYMTQQGSDGVWTASATDYEKALQEANARLACRHWLNQDQIDSAYQRGRSERATKFMCIGFLIATAVYGIIAGLALVASI